MSSVYKGIIFDMDGVLVDSEKLYFTRRVNFLKAHGIPTESLTYKETIGGNFKDIVANLISDQPIDLDILKADYVAYKNQHPLDYTSVLNPDAPKILRYLKEKHYTIGLASSSTAYDIQEMLVSCQLKDYFDVVVSGEEFEKSKPNPEIYLYTMKKLNLTPATCVAIEDSEKGILAAHDAGMETWALRDTHFGLDQSLADKVMDSLYDISLYF